MFIVHHISEIYLKKRGLRKKKITIARKNYVGGGGLFFFSKILKMHDFNKDDTRNTADANVRPRTTCRRHITGEFGLKS